MASDVTLPLIANVHGITLFSARCPIEGSEPSVRLFSKPYVYELGSVQGCACGFVYDPSDLELLSEPDVPTEFREGAIADHEARRQSVSLLKEYLLLAVATGTAEVYSCWIGDEDAVPGTRLDVSLDHFGGDTFNLVKKQFLIVRSASGE